VNILLLLVALSVVLVALVAVVFLWAVRSGQFDDLEGPAYSILSDDDEKLVPESDDHDTPRDR